MRQEGTWWDTRTSRCNFSAKRLCDQFSAATGFGRTVQPWRGCRSTTPTCCWSAKLWGHSRNSTATTAGRGLLLLHSVTSNILTSYDDSSDIPADRNLWIEALHAWYTFDLFDYDSNFRKLGLRSHAYETRQDEAPCCGLMGTNGIVAMEQQKKSASHQ
eukprot:SAG31_NODE_718_length_12607_cov_21.723937_2_plen_159_part_00